MSTEATKLPEESGARPAPPTYPDHIDKEVLVVAGVVVLGMIMAILDSTVVNVALPTFQTAFAKNGQALATSTVAWTVTGYTLALATVIPLTGWAADRFGTKRLFMIAIGLFTAGSILCSTATGINQLVIYRVLQGLGGGMLMPLGMTIMTKAAGPKRMGRLMAILGVPMLLGPIAGPILGGWLIDKASWHWIFIINVPIGIVALVYAWFALPKDVTQRGETFDFLGMLMLSPGLAAFLYGISSIPGGDHPGFGKTQAWLPTLIGGVLIVAFGFYSFKPKHPLLDLRLFRHRVMSISIIVMAMFFIAFFGAMVLLPSYFQQVHGASPMKAGWLVAPQGLGAMITMPLAGWLSEKFPVGRIVPVGLVLIMGGMFGLTRLTDSTSYTYSSIVLFVAGLGMGLTMMPMMTSALRTLESHEVARGSTLININQQIAASIGAAIMSVVLTNRINDSKAVAAGKSLKEATEAHRQPSTSLLQYVEKLGGSKGLEAAVLHDLGHAFAFTFMIGFALTIVTFIASLMLPRQHEESHFADDEGARPVMIH